MNVTIDKCIACLEVTSVDSDRLCEVCAHQNASLDGSLLELLRDEEEINRGE